MGSYEAQHGGAERRIEEFSRDAGVSRGGGGVRARLGVVQGSRKGDEGRGPWRSRVTSHRCGCMVQSVEAIEALIETACDGVDRGSSLAVELPDESEYNGL